MFGRSGLDEPVGFNSPIYSIPKSSRCQSCEICLWLTDLGPLFEAGGLCNQYCVLIIGSSNAIENFRCHFRPISTLHIKALSKIQRPQAVNLLQKLLHVAVSHIACSNSEFAKECSLRLSSTHRQPFAILLDLLSTTHCAVRISPLPIRPSPVCEPSAKEAMRFWGMQTPWLADLKTTCTSFRP